jgi:hypothetical protein
MHVNGSAFDFRRLSDDDSDLADVSPEERRRRLEIRNRIRSSLPHIEDANERVQRERLEARQQEVEAQRAAEAQGAQSAAVASDAEMKKFVASIGEFDRHEDRQRVRDAA